MVGLDEQSEILTGEVCVSRPHSSCHVCYSFQKPMLSYGVVLAWHKSKMISYKYMCLVPLRRCLIVQRFTQRTRTEGEGFNRSWVTGELDTRASRASALRSNLARRRSRIFWAFSCGVMLLVRGATPTLHCKAYSDQLQHGRQSVAELCWRNTLNRVFSKISSKKNEGGCHIKLYIHKYSQLFFFTQ